MNILIIENVWMGGAKYGLFDRLLLTSFSILPTLYARQLAAVTPEKHNVHVLNERYENINYEGNYGIVNINFTTSTAPRAYEIADKFREHKTTVVLSGMHASACPKEAKKHADSVLLGRGEVNWLELLKDYEKNKLKPIYDPLNYPNSTKIPSTEITLPGIVLTGAIEATRGCPYCCKFCPESNIPGGSKYFKRPIEEVISEIKKLPQKTFMFYDNSLTIDSKYTKELFREMKKLRKRFFCNGNVDVLAEDAELVKLSKEAGCVAWLVGFESINQKTLEQMGKKTNKIKNYKKAVLNIHKNKMAIIGEFMFGFDTDTSDVFKDTLRRINELGIDAADFTIVTPFPATPLFEQLKKEKRLLTEDWKNYNLRSVVFQPRNMSVDELRKGLIKMYKEFFSTDAMVARTLRSLRLGIYPFLLVFMRNFTSFMAMKTIR